MAGCTSFMDSNLTEDVQDTLIADKPNKYFCLHCKKELSYKTYLRHRRQYLKSDKSKKHAINLHLPSLSSDSDMEQCMYYI